MFIDAFYGNKRQLTMYWILWAEKNGSLCIKFNSSVEKYWISSEEILRIHNLQRTEKKIKRKRERERYIESEQLRGMRKRKTKQKCKHQFVYIGRHCDYTGTELKSWKTLSLSLSRIFEWSDSIWFWNENNKKTTAIVINISTIFRMWCDLSVEITLISISMPKTKNFEPIKYKWK